MSDENKDEKLSPKKTSYFKKFIRIVLYIIGGIIGLNVILYALLSIPAVQQSLVDFAIDKIKPIIKTEVSIDKVQLSLFNRVNLQGVYIESQEKDTLLYAKNLDVKLNIWELLNNKLTINSIVLNGAFANVSQETPDSPFNFQFLIDAFASDTTKKSSPSSLRIVLEDIKIENSRISYNVLSKPETPSIFNTSHISISDFNTQISLKSIDLANLDAAIKSLSLKEKSGLRIENIEAGLKSKMGKIWSDKLIIQLPNSNIELDSLNYNLFNKRFVIDGNLHLSPLDLKIIMPELKNLTSDIELTTNISGKLPQIDVNNLNLTYGDDTKLLANASISDYQHYETSKLLLNIEQFKTTTKTISQFAQIADSSFVLPEVLSSIDNLRLNGKAEGELKDIKLNAEAWTNQGSVLLKSNISVKDSSFQNYNLRANLQTQNFNLAPFIGKEIGLGRISLHSDLKLASNKGNISADITGVVNQLQHDSTTIRNVRFKANYSPTKMGASIDADLPIGKLVANASMTQTKNPQIEFDIDIHKLQISRFYNNPDWVNPLLSVCLKGSFKGNSIDNIVGLAVMDSLRLWGDNFDYRPGKLVFESGINDGNRYIDVKSFLLSARIDGQYKFSTLMDEFSNLMYPYFPGIFAQNKRVKTNGNNFNFDVNIFNTQKLGEIIALPVDIIEPINIHGIINTIANQVKVDSEIPHIRFGETDIKNSSINISNGQSAFDINAISYIAQESGNITVNLKNAIQSDTINSLLSFKNEGSDFKFNGELKAASHFETTKKGGLHSYLQFSPSHINVEDLNLSFLPARIENVDGRTTIANFGFMVGRGRMLNKYFAVDGAISDQKEDSLNISFDNARLGQILRTFKINNINANANGNIRLTNVLDKPEIYTDNLQLNDIIVFNDTLGTLNLKSKWNSSADAIDFNLTLANKDIESKVYGLVYTNEDKLDVNIDMEKLSMKWLQPFVADILNRVDGSISSHISLKGKMTEPKAEGWLGFNDAYIGVDFTNVTYHVSDTIKVFADKVGFRDLIIEDNNKNKATVSALVNYSNFDKMELLMNLDLDKFLILNTETRTDSLFYGKLIASGNVKIRGNLDDLKIDMKIRNEKNSSMNISIPEVSEAADYEGIVYINTPVQDSSKMIPVAIEKPLPLKIAMDLSVTPEINLAVIMNSANPINMQMKGKGLIKFDYDMKKENMKAYGDYHITGGTVKIRPQNIKTLEFLIQEGSKVNLNGDPTRASFDINAYYKVNASLATLDPSFSKTKVQVNCILGIKGNVNKMDLTYNISLPNASDDIKQKVLSLVNTNEQKVRQFANLILFSSFYSNAGSSDPSGSMLSAIASSTLSGGLNALFGNVLGNNWQIGTNIDTGDGASNTEMSVNVSTKLLDDKLTLNTNLGYRNDKASTSENTFVGDFDVEYQLSEMIKLKAYNHTNDQFYKRAPTTQGIGLVYTKEAKTLRELFRFFSKKKKTKEKTKGDSGK